MISFKVLLILTVSIDLICCNQKKVIECKETLKTIGFNPMSGFYNYHFTRQFDNFNEFVKYVKAKMNYKETDEADATSDNRDLASTSVKKRKFDEMAYNVKNETLPENLSYLYPVYMKIHQSTNRDITMTPFQYCHFMAAQKTQKKSVMERFAEFPESELIPKEQLRKLLVDYALSKEPALVQMTPQEFENAKLQAARVESCSYSILEYKLEYNNIIYKYDRKNEHKNIITSFKLGKPGDFKLVMNSVETRRYFDIHMKSLTDNLFSLEKLTVPALCEWYFSVFSIDLNENENIQSQDDMQQ